MSRGGGLGAVRRGGGPWILGGVLGVGYRGMVEVLLRVGDGGHVVVGEGCRVDCIVLVCFRGV